MDDSKGAPKAEIASRSVIKNALAMALGTTSSRVLGLVREVLFAAFFSRAVTDAWIAAFRLPNLFRRLLGEGSLSVSFVPVYVEARYKDQNLGTQEARGLLDGFFTLLLLVLITLTALGIVGAEGILKVLLAPEYVLDAAKFEMTVRMAKIMFGFVGLVSLYAFFMGVLNALGIFGLPAMAPMLFNVAMVGATLLPPDWFPYPGDGLAWGVLVGGVLQMAILIPALHRRGALPRVRFVWSRNIRHVLINMVPGLFGLGLLQLTLLINMRFASELGEGPISWINWADRLLELPLSLISVSLGTALLPTLSELWAKDEKAKMSDTLSFTLRLNLYLCLACAVGLFALARPIVEVLFQRGRFTEVDTLATVGVLQVWAILMIPTATLRVLAPAYYAVKNTWLPAVVSACCLIVHVVVAPELMARMGLTGLNLSSLLSQSLNMLALLALFPVLVTGLAIGKITVAIFRFVPALIALWLGTQSYFYVRPMAEGFIWNLACLVFAIGIGGVLFGVVSAFTGLEEWDRTAQTMVRKIRRRMGL